MWRHSLSVEETWLLDAARSFVKGTTPPSWPRSELLQDAVLEQAGRAGLLEIVSHQLQLHGDPLPPRLAGATSSLAMLRLLQQADLASVVRCLEGAGVRWLMLKGPVLDQVVFRVPGVRRYADIDVLVHPADFVDAWGALREIPAQDLDLNWARLARTEQSEITLRLPFGTPLDLHWHLISNKRVRSAFRLDLLSFFDRSQTVTVDGLTVPTLCPDDTVRYVAMHAALAGAHEIRWMIDFHEASRWSSEHLVGERRDDRDCALELITAVIADRATNCLQAQIPALVALSRRSCTWRWVCRVVSRYVPVSSDNSSRYTGRALFSATRRDLTSSLLALLTTTMQSLRRGRARRTAVIDRAPIRTPGGSSDDLSAWLAVVTTAGKSSA